MEVLAGIASSSEALGRLKKASEAELRALAGELEPHLLSQLSRWADAPPPPSSPRKPQTPPRTPSGLPTHSIRAALEEGSPIARPPLASDVVDFPPLGACTATAARPKVKKRMKPTPLSAPSSDASFPAGPTIPLHGGGDPGGTLDLLAARMDGPIPGVHTLTSQPVDGSQHSPSLTPGRREGIPREGSKAFLSPTRSNPAASEQSPLQPCADSTASREASLLEGMKLASTSPQLALLAEVSLSQCIHSHTSRPPVTTCSPRLRSPPLAPLPLPSATSPSLLLLPCPNPPLSPPPSPRSLTLSWLHALLASAPHSLTVYPTRSSIPSFHPHPLPFASLIGSNPRRFITFSSAGVLSLYSPPSKPPCVVCSSLRPEWRMVAYSPQALRLARLPPRQLSLA